MNVAAVYRTNGTVIFIEPKNGRTFTLGELQHAVGGYIEQVPTRVKDQIVFADEEGLLKRKPLNVFATETFGLVLVGDVIACPPETIE